MIFTAYADIEKYRKMHTELDENEVKRLLQKAEEAVGVLTGFAAEKRGLESFGAFEKEMLEKAVFAQADFILENGEDDKDGSGEPISVKLGSFSYSYGTSSASGTSSKSERSKAVLGYLEAAGLLSRRIGVI